MRKVLCLLMVFLLVFSFCGCGSQENVNGIVQISAAECFLVAVKGDGTVVASGPNSDELKIEDWKNVKKIVAGFDTLTLRGSIIAALHNDGTVSANGYKTTIAQNGIINEYSESFSACLIDVSEWKDITDIATSGNYLFAINSKGEVFVEEWSYNTLFSPDYPEFKDVKSIASGGGTNLIGLKGDGTVVGAGSATLGQTDVSAWKDIIQVDSCRKHTVGLRSKGTLIATKYTENPNDTAIDKEMQSRYNEYGELDFKDWKNIKAISVSDNFTVGLKKNGTVVATGDNSFGQCDVNAWSDIKAISTTLYATYGLKKDGTIVSTGKYTYNFDN